MINGNQIEKWVMDGTITAEQAEKMLLDVNEAHKEEKSNRLIISVSTIGAILFGIGAILFIATNWQVISDPIKILLALIVTFGAYCLGYLFKYQKQNLPKVGSALLFLGAILFGGTIMLVAQIYHINANAHSLVLIWLIGILPLVYGFKSEAITALSSILFLIWIGLFIFRNQYASFEVFHKMPVIYLISGLLLFSIGGMHYGMIEFSKIARIFRLVGIKIAMLSLFLLTFKIFSGGISDYWMPEIVGGVILPSTIMIGVILFSILTILGLIVNLFFNPSKSRNNLAENGPALLILIFTLVFLFFPATTNIYTLLFNLIFAGVTGFLIYTGYERADITLVNVGVTWLSVFIFAKYFDFFWGMMPVSLFFLVGGIILVLGGIALEGKRRKIKEEFKKINT